MGEEETLMLVEGIGGKVVEKKVSLEFKAEAASDGVCEMIAATLHGLVVGLGGFIGAGIVP